MAKNREKANPTDSDRRVLLPEDEGALAPLEAAPVFAWTLLGLIGLVFFLVGGADLLLVWYPLNFGSPEWEFGTVSAALDGLPVPALGLAMILGAGAARGQRWLVRTCAILFLVLALIIIAAAVIYVTTVPMALQAAPDPFIRIGLKKAIAKSTVQAIVYPVFFVWIAVAAWRHSRVTVEAPVM